MLCGLAFIGVPFEAVPFEAALAEAAFVRVPLEAVPFEAALAEAAFVRVPFETVPLETALAGLWPLIAHDSSSAIERVHSKPHQAATSRADPGQSPARSARVLPAWATLPFASQSASAPRIASPPSLGRPASCSTSPSASRESPRRSMYSVCAARATASRATTSASTEFPRRASSFARPGPQAHLRHEVVVGTCFGRDIEKVVGLVVARLSVQALGEDRGDRREDVAPPRLGERVVALAEPLLGEIAHRR